MKNGLIVILVIVISLLLIPFIAMQFTMEVNWAVGDFITAGMLLLATGVVYLIIMKKVKNIKVKISYVVAILALLSIVWIELAVGIFGIPFAGS